VLESVSAVVTLTVAVAEAEGRREECLRFVVKPSMKAESGAVRVGGEDGCGGLLFSLSERLCGVRGGVLGVLQVLLVHCAFGQIGAKSSRWFVRGA